MKVEFPNVDPVRPEGELYVVTRNSDLTEGRGRSVNAAFYDDLDEAVAGAKGIDVQGSDGTVYKYITLLPEKRVKVWGTQFIPELGISYTGFSPESGRGIGDDLRDKIAGTREYKEFLTQKEKYERYGL